METKEKTIKKTVFNNGVIDKNQLRGRFKLTYKVTNSMGPSAFVCKSLNAYSDPFTGKMLFRTDINGKIIPKGFEINSTTMILEGSKEQNQQSFIDIIWLLNHPDVDVQGVSLDDRIKNNKKGNSKIKLINIDLQDLKEQDDQEVIDILLGTLSLETGVKSVGINKLKWVLAVLNLPFRDKRHLGSAVTEKKLLRNKVKNYVRKGVDQAIEVNEALNNLDHAQKTFVIKNLINWGIYQVNAGSIKHDGVVLGHNIDAVLLKYDQSPEYWVSAEKIYAEEAKKHD